MKILFFAMSAMMLLSFGCNQNRRTDNDIQREERLDRDDRGDEVIIEEQREEVMPMDQSDRSDSTTSPIDERVDHDQNQTP